MRATKTLRRNAEQRVEQSNYLTITISIANSIHLGAKFASDQVIFIQQQLNSLLSAGDLFRNPLAQLDSTTISIVWDVYIMSFLLLRECWINCWKKHTFKYLQGSWLIPHTPIADIGFIWKILHAVQGHISNIKGVEWSSYHGRILLSLDCPCELALGNEYCIRIV